MPEIKETRESGEQKEFRDTKDSSLQEIIIDEEN
jgi:hypothetical protein